MTGLQTLNGSSRRVASAPNVGDPFSLISRDFDRMIGSIFGGRSVAPQAFAEAGEAQKTLLNPRIDVFDAEDHIELSAELPGVEQGDVDVSVQIGRAHV